MALKKIVGLLKRRNKQKERFAGILGKSEKGADSSLRPIPILDDQFEEASTGVFAQIKKYPILNIAEFLETQRTSFNKHSIFIVEILDDVVNASIVSRKGTFLDIGFLKSYSYDDLKDIYFKIVPDSKETSGEIKNSVESIVSIVAYDVVYALPKKIVIIENSNSELKEISVIAGRFIDESDAKDLMLRDLSFETGLSEDKIVYSAIKKPFKKGNKKLSFLVSLVEKEYYDSVNEYMNEAGFALKKIHSIESSLYASFSLKDRSAVMRIHVQNAFAYTLHKTKGESFEYYAYDINNEYETLELTSLQMEEVILSGSGDYYEMLKSNFLEAGISVRWWNYAYDLNRCIIRVEEGCELTNNYANIISTAYYELFNMRLALVRLGVGTKLSFYEIVAINLSVIPILMVIFTLFGVTGWYYYERTKIDEIEVISKKYSSFFNQKKSLNSQISRHQNSIATAQGKIATINRVIKDKIEIQDAAILYEIAMKLPDDMILTGIRKHSTGVQGQEGETVITVEGKTFLERSLLNYIESLSIKGKNVYLMSMTDSKNTRLETNEEANMRHILEFQKELSEKREQESKEEQDSTESETNTDTDNIRMLELLLGGAGTEVEYAETLNNSFVLEIR